MTTLRLEIDGMSCAGCAGRAERALTSLPGVDAATVNFATGTAQVDTGTASLDAITGALSSAGYPARTAQTTLSIDGMHCASCVGRVEDSLTATPGVLTATVNLATQTAQVTYLAGTATPADLARVVTQSGYPARPSEEDTPDPAASRRAAEITHARRMTLLAGALTLPVFVTEMGGHLIPAFHHWLHGLIGQPTLWTLQFILTTLVLAFPGRQFFTLGLPALFRGAPDMNSLVALGTLAAWGYSTLALFAPTVLPPGTVAVYFEAAAVIVTLILLGRWMEARARGRTGAAIRRLIGLQPDTARVIRNGENTEIPVAQVGVGDRIQLRPGERIPVDGSVTDGTSYVDESMISGEPLPVSKSDGDALIAGTINGDGALTMTATGVGRDTMLARIVAMVQEAQGAKLPIQALADRVVRIFVPVVIATAVLTVLTWLTFGPNPALGLALVAGVSVLIIACPCAMGLATPTSIMVGTGRAAELGVLFRKGDALQTLAEAKVVAFDKTGTLTMGRPTLTTLHLAPGFDRAETLAAIAAAEAQSEHPIARAIEAAAQAEGLTLPAVKAFKAKSGHGLTATVDHQDILVGTARLMQMHDIDTAPFKAELDELANKGETPVFAAIDTRIAALLAVSDPIKDQARDTIQALHGMGLQTALITGDTAATAHAVAARLGIDHVEAEVLPGDKRDTIARLQEAHGATAFVGDGINDAPALAQADIGIAMGTGTDVAIESADVVLVSGNPANVLTALHVSRRTLRNIRQNLFWAFAYNAALIPVAAGALYPVTGALLSPMLAAGAMALSSVFVLTNALRLRRLTPETPQ
ncbi:heavy metal translocating P-type ATPase [Roseovarius sp. SK2]|uniref:heavy metal translocating P-type ATPase n=1 Tax=Roseovarius TaxID=74030 RepID=UPI00237A0C26|nr:heavy metal translocating P-type ATPase [Roseovarius sp. SK2]MDD9727011.1 heavy metal translocating P-type ATPase [Roseovarius sp. SK2]